VHAAAAKAPAAALVGLPQQFGRGHMGARRQDLQRGIDKLGQLGGPHRLLGLGNHELEDGQHPGREFLQDILSRRFLRLAGRAHQQQALKTQGGDGLLVEAGQAALERIGQAPGGMRHHHDQALHTAALEPLLPARATAAGAGVQSVRSRP
jgi:hypothetical protein